ncbi:hypothetical protein [Paraburkholderia sp. RL17-337-BIB-A]|uniref:hypothetical protein n=1 Tax=Paraburkholderia sp. RL17-337-BIB-A TaxID=3031636 RepID=UPI0038BE0590
MVSIYVGEYDGKELSLVCSGTTGTDGTVWQRMAGALGDLFPRPPYPQSNCLTVFVHEKSSVVDALRLDIVCRDGLAYTSVQSRRPRVDLEPVPVGMNDDVVAVARKVIDVLCPLTAVSVHAGAYMAHELTSAMPLVCTGTHRSVLGETLWERTALALRDVVPAGPYLSADVATIFVRGSDGLVVRFDVARTERGWEVSIVQGGLPRWAHAPFPVETGEDVVAVARKIFAAGLPESLR